MIVIDTSALLEWLLRGPRAEALDDYLRECGRICAPHLLDSEVVKALQHYCRTGELTPERALEVLQDLRGLHIWRFGSESFLERILELSQSMDTVDATFLALAEVKAIPLLTCDQELKRKGGHLALVELV